MSTPSVKVGKVAYTQGAAEVIIRLNLNAARGVLVTLEAAHRAGTVVLPEGHRLLEDLRKVLDA